ncbi:RluA family pseudouridine synthase [Alkalicoccus chagannorensis]|uniref:RluA family pseudouridine synthase n=1 Tax=Alkalicoccus chagannorensis TaxID=427072 RepID=UPI00040A98C8|nr:RluA family pseudouridine synthase [Alkalicoccus chagannorensis]
MGTPAIQWTVPEEADGKLLRFFLRTYAGFSRKLLADVKFHGGEIVLNGREQKVTAVVQQGDVVEVRLPPEKQSSNITPAYVPGIEILYEDDFILLLYKPAGVVVIPTVDRSELSVASHVLKMNQEQHLPFTFHPVTRLDRGTSGIVLAARHALAHGILSTAQADGRIHRIYECAAGGGFPWSAVSVSAPIARKAGSYIKRGISCGGKEARSHFQLMERGADFSRIQAVIETGRTHQIRLHMAWLGWPLLGDGLYGQEDDDVPRLHLHARAVEFLHPYTQERFSFDAGPGFQLSR